jgi:phytoene synthase
VNVPSVGARVTRGSGTNFYYAFRVLPKEKRRALEALYAFCRVVDDCVDEEGGEGEAGLARWLAEARRAYDGTPETDLGRELAETVARFPVPRASFEDVVAGCRMDLATRRYPTFADLRVYCERVASAVGLASIEIFGYDDPRTREYAVELGLALQLTNILRDVGADALRDRLYLPLEDLSRFGVGEGPLLAAARDAGAPRPPGLDRLLAFEADRARSHYAAAARALPGRDRRSMLAAEIMGAIYRAVLEEWGRRGHPVGGTRVALSRPRKVAIALRTFPRVLWGA